MTEPKPRLMLLHGSKAKDLDDLAAFFERVTGRAVPPEELAAMRAAGWGRKPL